MTSLRWWQRVRRASLLTKFGVLSALAMLVIALLMGRAVNASINGRAIENAEKSATLVADLSVMPLLDRTDISRGRLSHRQISILDGALSSGVKNRQVSRINIWRSDGVLLYSSDRKLIGDKRQNISGEFADVIEEGSPEAELGFEEDAGSEGIGRSEPTLETYVPLDFGGAASPDAVFEIYFPYEPLHAAAAADTRQVYGVIFGCLLLLYLVLFRTVAKASSNLRRQAEVNEQLAMHDALTGLPNRLMFHQRVGQAQEDAARRKGRMAVGIIDLDRFKEVNDTLGHVHGDTLLKDVGPRLKPLLRESDTVARLGGDEFGIVVNGLNEVADMRDIARRIQLALDVPFKIGDLLLDVGASLGIAISPDDGNDVDELLRAADVAMYRAKESGSSFEFYEAGADRKSRQRLAVSGELRRGLERGEIVAHYQPKVDLTTGGVIGFEALARWNHPDRGILGPQHFIDIAEQTSLIRPLAVEMIKAAVNGALQLRDEQPDIKVSVNLAMQNMMDVSLPERIQTILDEAGAPADVLVIEVTESSIIHDARRVKEVLDELHGMGIEVSVDDFGTGYSSLTHLRQLPVSEIKIDRSFVAQMENDPSDAAIVRATADLGRNLGIMVTAEGVETEEQWDRLRAAGCDVAQGFLVSKPAPLDDIISWMRSRATVTT